MNMFSQKIISHKKHLQFHFLSNLISDVKSICTLTNGNFYSQGEKSRNHDNKLVKLGYQMYNIIKLKHQLLFDAPSKVIIAHCQQVLFNCKYLLVQHCTMVTDVLHCPMILV